jgi:hypothetical protein
MDEKSSKLEELHCFGYIFRSLSPDKIETLVRRESDSRNVSNLGYLFQELMQDYQLP